MHRPHSHIGQFMTLYPGDVINTGAPSRVVLGVTGTAFLKPGEVVKLDGLNRQCQTVGVS